MWRAVAALFWLLSELVGFFEAVVNEIVLMISFFMFVIGIQEGYSFLYVDLVSCHFARCVYQLQEFSGRVLRDFM